MCTGLAIVTMVGGRNATSGSGISDEYGKPSVEIPAAYRSR